MTLASNGKHVETLSSSEEVPAEASASSVLVVAPGAIVDPVVVVASAWMVAPATVVGAAVAGSSAASSGVTQKLPHRPNAESPGTAQTMSYW
jgi:hypothetical protein